MAYQHKMLFEELIYNPNLKQSKDYKYLIHIHLNAPFCEFLVNVRSCQSSNENNIWKSTSLWIFQRSKEQRVFQYGVEGLQVCKFQIYGSIYFAWTEMTIEPKCT